MKGKRQIETKTIKDLNFTELCTSQTVCFVKYNFYAIVLSAAQSRST